MCVDPIKNHDGFEKLQELLEKGVVETLLIVPLAKQDDEQPVLFVDGGKNVAPVEVPADGMYQRALSLVSELQVRHRNHFIEEVHCRFYDCPESYLEDEILSWSRGTNRDCWLVLEERKPILRPRVHIQFHCKAPDVGWFEEALEAIEKQLERR
jgi:hypothetical protein